MRTEPLRLTLLGRSFVGHALPPYLVAWLEAAWGDVRQSAAPDSQFTIELVGRAPGTSPDRPSDARPERAGLWVSGESPRWTFHADGGSGELIIEGDRARIRLWPAGSEAQLGIPFFEGLFLLLSTAFSVSGLIPVHASAATPPGASRAHLFLAASGTGKSTTLLRLVSRGWIPLMEDFGWIDPVDDSLWGWDVGVRVLPESRARFAPDLTEQEWTVDADGKLLLSYDALGAPAPRRGRVGRIVILQRDPARPEGWSEATPRDGVRALWEAVGALLAPAARGMATAWIAHRVRSGTVHRYNLGDGGLPTPLS